MNHHTTDVVVIGGGVIGGSIAYHLAKRGRRVLLLERGRIAEGASGAAAGMLGAQSEMHEPGPLYDLARRSRAMFPRLAAELKDTAGLDIGLIQRGLLRVAMAPAQAEECRRMIAFQRESGEEAEWLSPRQARELEPQLTDRMEGAMRIPGDGQVSAPDLAAAYMRAAGALGAEVREYSSVYELRMERGRIAGVVSDQGTIACEQAVVAAGVDSGRLLAQAGLNIEVYPVKGECFSVVTGRPLVTSSIFTPGCYAVPKRGGRLVIGATMVERAYDRKVSAGAVMSLLAKANALLPAIAEAEWERSWAGLRPQTPDGLPYLGEASAVGCQGLFVAAGHYRNGVLLSPITGELIAEQMCGGKPRFDSWDAFAPERHTFAGAGVTAGEGK